jgi:hypothetical protein
MLASGDRYAQTGWWEKPYGERHTFVQWGSSTGWATYYWAPKQTGGWTYYTTLWDPARSVFTYHVDGAQYWESLAHFQPSNAQIYGETNSLATQMPGGYNAHEIFWDSNVYLNGWRPFQGIPYIESGNSAYFGLIQNQSYPKVIEIWDKYCAS